MILKLAWRNLWRNKRRSLITMASMMFAVVFVVLMRSFQIGTYDTMTNAVVNMYTGPVQIHAKGFWNDQSLDNSFVPPSELLQMATNHALVNSVIPRVEGFSLAAFGQLSKGVLVLGVHPDKEKNILNVNEKLIAGDSLQLNKGGIWVAQDLAEYFKLNINDTLVLFGQGYHGVTAAGKYKVQGVVKFNAPEMNKSTVVLSLPQAQSFFSLDENITHLILSAQPYANLQHLTDDLQQPLDTALFEVMTWQNMLPELVQSIQADNAGGLIMAFILYMIVFFGIFGTIIMMTAERQYEFAILISIGLSRMKLALMMILETLLLGILGVFSGYVLVYPIIYYFNVNPIEFTGEMAKMIEDVGFEPIIPTSLNPSIVLTHAAIIFMVSLVLSLYPIIKIYKLQPTQARRL